jgi:hypothetical protein
MGGAWYTALTLWKRGATRVALISMWLLRVASPSSSAAQHDLQAFRDALAARWALTRSVETGKATYHAAFIIARAGLVGCATI